MPKQREDGMSNERLRRENIAALERYLAAAECIPEHPTRKGEVNYSAIAVGADVRRPWLYDDVATAMIQRAAREKGLGMPQQRRAPGAEAVPAWATQRIKALEEQLAVSKAEARQLRERLRRFEHIEQHMADTGRIPR